MADWKELRTVQSRGWAGISNGELLRKAEGQFDLFLTADKRLRYVGLSLPGQRCASPP